ncbi:MAG: hypothetical protein CMP40_02160 [Rickettsiales bacterium]|nr:hypothetical protein [Rickettsiales bacterium]
MSKNYIITIDGPAASGKGAISKILSKELNFYYLETGIYYRILARKIKNNKIQKSDYKKYILSLKTNNFDFSIKNREDLYKPEISKLSSFLAKEKIVREFILERQRYLINNSSKKYKGILLEGRDCGTVIAPQADIKIYITSDLNVRAKRRYDQYKAENKEISFDDVYLDLSERDNRDKNRSISPLKKAEDAVEINNTTDNLKETINIVKNIIFSKIPTLKN